MKRLKDKPFALIGMNSDGDLDTLRQVRVDKELTWRSFWNGPDGTGGPISRSWGVRGWPTIFVIDEKGVIRDKNVRGEKMDAAVDKLLAGMSR